MAQGDKRLFFNTRERFVSDDMNRLQAIEAAERAARLRGLHNDILGDWYAAGGLQTPVVSSAPSLLGDVYAGLMVQPDNAGYYLVQPGVAGFLDPAGVGADDNPYRLVNDPGQQTPAVLAFTSNGGGGSPRWDVVECQPVDTVVAQESRYIFNPATGIASPVLVDKVKAGRLTYRVRIGVVGGGFPGVAAGWMPLAVVCAPAGSTSLLTSDVWDVRPLVRERVRFNPVNLGGSVGLSPVRACQYRHRVAADAAFNQWVGTSESIFNGYEAGGRLERSTPSTLAQFGSTGATGGRAGVVNGDLADNKSTFALTSGGLVYVAAVFPGLLPRWQRYSQVPVGSGRVPNGPRGILLVTTVAPNANGIYNALPMPAAAAFGAGNVGGCMLAAVGCNATPIPLNAWANGTEHWIGTSASIAGAVVGNGGNIDITAGQYFPASAKRVLLAIQVTGNNTGGLGASIALASVKGTTDASDVSCFTGRVALPAGNPVSLTFQAWFPVIPLAVPTDPTAPAQQRIAVTTGFSTSVTSLNATVLAWSASDL